MRRYVLLVLVLVACRTTRTSKAPKPAMRPLEVGTFKGYTISPCASGGHVVKLATEPDERGEANNRLMVNQYRDRYLVPKLERIDIKGWTWDGTCNKSGLTLRVLPGEAGEALHRIGETLKAHPTDIEVVVVPAR
jgi:hypothetical protein